LIHTYVYVKMLCGVDYGDGVLSIVGTLSKPVSYA